jgi:hypothetical protein
MLFVPDKLWEFHYVIPAGETPIPTFPLQGGRDDRLLSRKRERIEVRAAGMTNSWKIPATFISG